MLMNSQQSSTAAGYVTECHGVQIRAQLRSVATVLQVTGLIGAANHDMILDHLRRFTRLQTPLVLDLFGCQGFGADLLRALLDEIDAGDLTLVIDPDLGDAALLGCGVDVVSSVAQALGGVAARIRERRTSVLIPAISTQSAKPVIH
jgi:hypothetical protein